MAVLEKRGFAVTIAFDPIQERLRQEKIIERRINTEPIGETVMRYIFDEYNYYPNTDIGEVSIIGGSFILQRNREKPIKAKDIHRLGSKNKLPESLQGSYDIICAEQLGFPDENYLVAPRTLGARIFGPKVAPTNSLSPEEIDDLTAKGWTVKSQKDMGRGKYWER